MTDERRQFDEARDFEHVADQLCEVTLTLEQTDYNAFAIEEDLRAILDIRDRISDMCLRYRQDQRAAERRRAEADDDG